MIATNYFKAAVEGFESVGGVFFFFDDQDRGSVEVAYSNACQVSHASRVSAWRKPDLTGPWTGSVNVIGDGLGLPVDE